MVVSSPISRQRQWRSVKYAAVCFDLDGAVSDKPTTDTKLIAHWGRYAPL